MDGTQRATTEAIRAVTRAMGIKRSQIAQRIGAGSSLISARLACQSPWRLEEVVTIADWLELSVNDLVRGPARALEALTWKLDQEAREKRLIDAANEQLRSAGIDAEALQRMSA